MKHMEDWAAVQRVYKQTGSKRETAKVLSDHVYMYDSQEKELVLADKMEERQQQRTEAQKDAKEAEQEDKPGKAERGEKKPERERVSM